MPMHHIDVHMRLPYTLDTTLGQEAKRRHTSKNQLICGLLNRTLAEPTLVGQTMSERLSTLTATLEALAAAQEAQVREMAALRQTLASLERRVDQLATLCAATDANVTRLEVKLSREPRRR
jgi:septal ring factor EnvC (AmiA/AmiB activator)